MKKIYSPEIGLIVLIGLILVLVLAFAEKEIPPRSYIYDYNWDKKKDGQVKAASTEQITTYTEISPADVFNLIGNKNKDIVIIDVSSQYKLGHIPSAVSVPIKEIDQIAFGLDKNKNYIIYCRNNTDSLVAIQKLVNYGFQKISRMSGGYNGWVNSKYKTER